MPPSPPMASQNGSSAANRVFFAMIKPAIPKPDIAALPENEREDGAHVVANLSALNVFRERYAAALFLLCECNEANEGRPSAISPIARPELSNAVAAVADFEMRSTWRQLAFRDAALSISHFSYILDGIVKGCYRCPTLLKSLDLTKLKTAQPLFEKAFPNAARMRNAIAHAGEILHSPATQAENKINYPGTFAVGGLSLTGATCPPTGTIMTGFKMFTTFKASVVTVELSPDKHNEMLQIIDAVYGAFGAHYSDTSEAATQV
jgi:hypothetical protein